MRLLPYDSFQIETTLPLEKVVERLSEKVDQHHLAWLLKSSSHNFEYRGQVNVQKFRIKRTQRFTSNSFLPLITGTFLRVGSGTLIHVEMGPRPIALLFMIFWFGFVSIFLLTTLIDLFSSGFSETSIPFMLVPSVMLVGGALSISYTFRNEAARQKIRLEGVFKGKELDSA